MEDFVNIDESKTISLDEYIKTIPDDSRRNAIVDMLSMAINFLELVKKNFRVTTPIPEVSVRTTSTVVAETNPLGIIIISAGMIDHCLDARWPQANEVLGKKAPYVLGTNLVAQIGMAWVLGHEYVHLFRCHHEVETELGSTKQVKRAFEHDADLCSTAAIYRYLQHMLSSALEDDDVRRYAAFALFWIIRSIPNTNDGAGIHPSFSERYFQIVLKLTSIQKDGAEPYDPEVKNLRTKARADKLVDAAMACEQAYQSINGRSGTSYLSEWGAYFSSGGHTRIIRDWIKVSPVVERLSGSRADMKAPYVDMRKAHRAAEKSAKAMRKAQRAARKKSRKG